MFASERVSVQVKLRNWNNANPSITVAYEGVDFVRPPADGTSTWVALQLLKAPGKYITSGTRKIVRRPGIIQLNVYTPDGKGAKPNDLLCEQLAALYVTPYVDGSGGTLQFSPAHVKTLGSRDGFFMQIVSIPYEYDFYTQGDSPMTFSLLQGTVVGTQDSSNTVFNVQELTTPGNIFVFLNGILQPATAFTAIAGQVTLATAPNPTDQIQIYVW